jgi:hypothetical protein
MTKMKILILIVVFSALFGGCDTNYGEAIVRDKVQVYYLEPITKKEAIALADFWEKNKLSTEHVQVLQLSRNKDVIQIKLIAGDSTLFTEIPFSIQVELAKLDSLIKSNLYDNEEFEIIISDKKFEKTKKIF